MKVLRRNLSVDDLFDEWRNYMKISLNNWTDTEAKAEQNSIVASIEW